jgi:predicted HTH transcriptional regulator
MSVRKSLNERRKLILSKMRDNPNITKTELQKILKISGTAVDNNIAFYEKKLHRMN